MDEGIKTVMDGYYNYWFGINALYEKWAKARGLTSNALFTLYMIHAYPDTCTQRLITEKAILPKQTVNAILSVFEQKGYTTKQVMPEDRRNKHILLTPEGQAYADALLSELSGFEARALMRMRPEERVGFVRDSHIFLEELSHELEPEDHISG